MSDDEWREWCRQSPPSIYRTPQAPITIHSRLAIPSPIPIHTPPAPTPVVRECCISSRDEQRGRAQLSPVERCLKRTPLPGNKGDDTIGLEVTGTLEAGDGHNSQVLTVEVLESTSPSPPLTGARLVATIYVPLYFEDDEGYLDPFRCMDKYYTHEANAYPALREFQGREIPTYHGSYILNLPVDEGRTRVVRIILIEPTPGVTMADAQPGDYSQADRQAIMKAVVNLESRIYEKNLWLTDLEPRNVSVRSPSARDHDDNDGQQQPRVVFVDMAHALFNRRRDDPLALTLNRFLGEYISPLLRWKNPQAQGGPPLRTGWTGIGDPWLTAEFAHTVTSITLEVRERWADI